MIKKLFLGITISLSLLFSLCLNPSLVFAKTIKDEGITQITYNQEEIQQIESHQIDEKNNQFSSKDADEYIYDWRLSDTKNGVSSGGYAGGQPIGGTVFSSPGGFYWTSGSNYINASVSVSFGVFSVAIPLGTTASTGYFITSHYTGIPVKLYVQWNVKVSKYNVYRKNKYGGTWTYYSTQYTTSPTTVILTVVRV